MAVSDAHVFSDLLTQVLTQLFFLKPQTTFLTCFCRGERQKYSRKQVCLNGDNLGSISQPPGHESDTFTTEPPKFKVAAMYGCWEKCDRKYPTLKWL